MKKILKGNAKVQGALYAELDANFLAIVKAMIKLANPDLNLKGYAESSTTEPSAPVENDCYLVIEDGTIWGLEVVDYNIISYDGAAWQIETYSLTELNAWFRSLFFAAENISYDNSTSGMTATELQAAIDEIWAALNP